MQVQPLTAARDQLSDRRLDLAGSSSCKQETEYQEVSGYLLRNRCFFYHLNSSYPRKKEVERKSQNKTNSKLRRGESERLDRVLSISLSLEQGRIV